MGERRSTTKQRAWAIGSWAFLIFVIAIPVLIGLWGFVDSVILRAIRG